MNAASAPQPADRHGSLIAALASLTVGAGFLALWFWLLPPWLGFHNLANGTASWRWLAAKASWAFSVNRLMSIQVSPRCPRPVAFGVAQSSSHGLIEEMCRS